MSPRAALRPHRHARFWAAPVVLFALASQWGCGRDSHDSANQAFEDYFGKRKPNVEERKHDKSDGSGKAANQEPVRLKLRMVYVVDERLPRLDREGYALFQRTLSNWLERGSKRTVEFEPGAVQNIRSFFSKHEETAKKAQENEEEASLFDPGSVEGLAAVRAILAEAHNDDIRALYASAPENLQGLDNWAKYVQDDLSAKYKAFAKEFPPHPALQDPEHPEYGRPDVWRALAQAEKADVIVTNALVAGPERGMDIDRTNRGSLLVGLWSPEKKDTDLGATLVFSVQPMLCQAPFTLDLPAMERPVLAGVCAWLFFQSRWEGAPAVVNPLGKAVNLLRKTGGQERAPEKK